MRLGELEVKYHRLGHQGFSMFFQKHPENKPYTFASSVQGLVPQIFSL
jgi:hypothetical protein